MSEQLCPKCGKNMFDKRPGSKFPKTNPKAADWVCSDKECKFQKDKQTGEWMESEYRTGLWEKKEEHKPKPQPKVPTELKNNVATELDITMKANMISLIKNIIDNQKANMMVCDEILRVINLMEAERNVDEANMNLDVIADEVKDDTGTWK
jgi:hypothetical protein